MSWTLFTKRYISYAQLHTGAFYKPHATNNSGHTIRYDTIEEINVDSKAEYTA